MDLAYDHIAEKAYADRSETPKPNDADGALESPTTNTNDEPQRPNLQTEFQETILAFSNSPWGTKLGGLWGNVRKQGETYYETARKEAEKREAGAAKALEGLRKTVVEKTKTVVEIAEEQLDKVVREDDSSEKREDTTAVTTASAATSSDSNDALEENETLMTRFKLEAAKRLKDVQKAEDVADEALLRFGTNIRNFLKEAVAITAPELTSDGRGSSEVLFESKDATTGKRVIHTSRFDAQLHVVHTTPASFTEDPSGSGEQWEEFVNKFDIDQKTEAIATHLDTHKELRAAMERLVPEQVDYKDFWRRYYFLRLAIELQEEKRKEMLKATTNDEEEVGWDEESDDETAQAKGSTTPHVKEPQKLVEQKSSDSSSTMQQPAKTVLDANALKPQEPRRSHDEKSVADSDASYDLISGATSRAAGSPKEKAMKIDESDEEDWE